MKRGGVGVTGDGADHDLDRSEPQRQVPGVMLEQDAYETLHRAADGPMDHHRRRLFTVARNIERAEALRQVEIDLRRPTLPIAADRVAQHIFELRPVEGALARIERGR